MCESGNSLQDIQYKELNCPLEDQYPDQDCYQYGCKCKVNRYYNEVTINCSNANLMEFPREVVELPDSKYSINLDLSGNEITDFPNDTNFSNYENIKVLNISRNKVDQMNHKYLPRNIEYISFDNNQITQINDETVAFFENYINSTDFHMKMGHNPYFCNCDAEGLLDFIDSHVGFRVEDRNDVFLKCSRGPLQLISAKLEDFCKSVDTNLLPIISTGAVLFGMIFFSF